MTQQTFTFKEEKPYKVTLKRGVHQIECWGAKGCSGGNGAYTKGILTLYGTKTFYLYIGEMGTSYSEHYPYNGGGIGQFSGGGSTDIRLVDGNWDNFESLKSRIMVAAGGGAIDSQDVGGSGGVLEGFNSTGNYGKGGTQTKGGDGYNKGSFGKGGGRNVITTAGNGGCGSGYYGGGSSTNEKDYGGGGGSSFVSGYEGCLAIKSESTESKIVHKSDSIHYSGFVFKSPIIIDGNSKMPSPLSKQGIEIGHNSNGYVRITTYFHISIYCRTKNAYNFVFFMVLIAFS